MWNSPRLAEACDLPRSVAGCWPGRPPPRPPRGARHRSAAVLAVWLPPMPSATHPDRPPPQRVDISCVHVSQPLPPAMLHREAETDADSNEVHHQGLASRLRTRCAGGKHGRIVLVTEYVPRKGQKKTIQSNHKGYGKSWATEGEIKPQDKLAFVRWIEEEMSRGGGSHGRAAQARSLPCRSSSRMEGLMTVVRTTNAHVLLIEHAVARCIQFLVDNVVHRARHDGAAAANQINFVPSKRRQKTSCSTTASSFYGLWANRAVHKASRRQRKGRLTQKKRESWSYNYRNGLLRLLAASRAEQDLDWLGTHLFRLATIVARQDLRELLPEGMASTARDSPC